MNRKMNQERNRMERAISRYACLAFSLCLLGCSLSAQAPASISGFVYDDENGEGLIGVNVYLEDTYLGASTNLNGYYVIPRVPAGDYVLVVRYIGYATMEKKIRIESSRELKLNLTLTQQPLELQTLVVSADSVSTAEKLYRKPVSEIALSPRDINQVPQIAEADLMRTLQTLPGIQPVSDFSSSLYVRGGTPDQNLFLLDGTDVYNAEHAFGLFSTFNTEAIKHVEVSKGGFSAEYGGRLSSVINITNLDGNREQFEGSVNISLLSAKTTLQMPLGKNGSLSGSVRRTYFDQTVGRAMDDIPDYYFLDGNVKAFFDIDRNNNLTLSYYGSQDVLNYIFNNQSTEHTGFKYDWGNRTGSIRWTHVFSPRMFSNFWVTASSFKSGMDMPAYHLVETNRITDFTVKGNLEYHHSSLWEMKFGFEMKKLDGLYHQSAADEGVIDIGYHPALFSGYAEGKWRPAPLWELQFGLRCNYFDSDTAYLNVAPRFALKRRLTGTAGLKLAGGVYYQYLHRAHRFFVADVWSSSNRYQAESESKHLVLGYQQEIADEWSLEVEMYYKTCNNLYSFNDNVGCDIQATAMDSEGRPVYHETDGVFTRGDGDSGGFEILLRKDAGRITGWTGYTLADTRIRVDGMNSGRYFPPRHSRTSTLNLVSNIRLNQKGSWVFGFNLVYASGQPFTEPGSAYLVSGKPDVPYHHLCYAPTMINNIRLPWYGRVDISLTYHKQYRGWAMSPYLQIYNAGNRKNVWFVDYEYHDGIPDASEQYMLPLLPSLGVHIAF